MAASESFEGRSCSIAESATLIARLDVEQKEKVDTIDKLRNNVSDLSKNAYLREQGIVLPERYINELCSTIPTHTCSIPELINALMKKNEALDEQIRITREYIKECDRRLVARFVADGAFG